MIETALLTAAAKRIAEDGYKAVRSVLEKSAAERTHKKAIEAAIQDHLTYLRGWSSDVVLEGMAQPRSIDQIFIDLDLNLQARWQRGHAAEDRTFKVSDIPATDWNILLIGDPGAGKTTSVKRVISMMLRSFGSRNVSRRTPFLIRCRVVPPEATLASQLAALFGVSGAALRADEPRSELRQLRKLLAAANATLFVDGLDELPGTSQVFRSDLTDLVRGSDGYRVVVTSRTAFVERPIEHCRILEVSPLATRQVGIFARKWLGPEQSQVFLQQVRATPYAGAELRPLTLAHLCLIYSRTRQIPEKPRSVYRMIIRLLLQDWDTQRGVTRTTRYADFQVDQKEEFLEAVAFRLSKRRVRAEFEHDVLEDVYRELSGQFNLPERQADLVARELESHTGLLLRAGATSYEFAHRSLQEYLAAQYIVRSPKLPLTRKEALRMPGELAIATTLSSAPHSFAALLVRHVFRGLERDDAEDLAPEWCTEYLSRLGAERARFSPSAELGVALLALFFFAMGSRVRASRTTIGGQSMKTPGVRDSLITLRHAFAVRRDPRGTWLHLSYERLRSTVSWADDVFAAMAFPEAIPTDVSFARAVRVFVDS